MYRSRRNGGLLGPNLLVLNISRQSPREVKQAMIGFSSNSLSTGEGVETLETFESSSWILLTVNKVAGVKITCTENSNAQLVGMIAAALYSTEGAATPRVEIPTVPLSLL